MYKERVYNVQHDFEPTLSDAHSGSRRERRRKRRYSSVVPG